MILKLPTQYTSILPSQSKVTWNIPVSGAVPAAIRTNLFAITTSRPPLLVIVVFTIILSSPSPDKTLSSSQDRGRKYGMHRKSDSDHNGCCIGEGSSLYVDCRGTA